MMGSQQSARSHPLEGYIGNCMQRNSMFTMVFVGFNGLRRVLALVGHGGELGSEIEYILPIFRFGFASKVRIMS
jgi:hypothetical protein